MQRRSLILLGSAAVIAMAGALLIKPPPPPAPPVGTGALAFPGLAQRLPNAARIEVDKKIAALDGAISLVSSGKVAIEKLKDTYDKLLNEYLN